MQRIKFLDGIRGVSILMVVVSHAASTILFPSNLSPIIKFFFDGNLGVRSFFVLSGFLITSILLNEENKKGNINLKNFYLKRTFRILPVYFLYILSIFIIDTTNGAFTVNTNSYIQAITFTTGLWLWGKGSWLLVHSWSLSIEEQFYLIWPLVMIFSKNRKQILILTFLSFPVIRLFAGYFKLLNTYNYSIFLQGDGIVAGCLLAFYYNDEKIQKYLKLKWIPIAFIIIYLIKVPFYFHSLVALTATCNNIIQSVLIAYIIATLLNQPKGFIYNFLNTSILIYIGRISFSLYIWQQLFLVPKGSHPQIAIFPYNIIMSIAIATVSYYLIELTFLRLRNKYIPEV
ncbi:acyltransferase family protein [Pedobacter montanisoli]|uniref:Acyltransferase n=1 Tax=Pedobacter montanisoli TaxID=2923277 RepID=A0ABS9ZVW3_9SPHI|nr:acyltransferase [Pedobacter montanisoli]MCJ0742442.1 acyltransferase [Pedobacter montanisoli]